MPKTLSHLPSRLFIELCQRRDLSSLREAYFGYSYVQRLDLIDVNCGYSDFLVYFVLVI